MYSSDEQSSKSIFCFVTTILCSYKLKILLPKVITPQLLVLNLIFVYQNTKKNIIL